MNKEIIRPLPTIWITANDPDILLVTAYMRASGQRTSRAHRPSRRSPATRSTSHRHASRSRGPAVFSTAMRR